MIELKQHDTARIITDTLTLNGVPINLTGATVNLIWYDNIASSGMNKNTYLPVIRSATITNAVSGQVSYQVVAADVANVTDFDLEWQIVFSGGTQLTVPTSGYIKLRIVADLTVPPPLTQGG